MKGVHSAMISETLEDEIVRGSLEPGTRLSEAAIAERFGVSRTPVREALQTIVSRSLAERSPYKGVIVRSFDAARLGSMFEAMAEMEATCGGLAAQRISEGDLARLQAMHGRMTEFAGNKAFREYEAMNLDFHSLIYEASGNVDLAEMSSELRLKLAPYRKSQLFQIDRLRASNLEHELIVRLLGAGNKPGVEEALRAHLNGARHAALKVRE